MKTILTVRSFHLRPLPRKFSSCCVSWLLIVLCFFRVSGFRPSQTVHSRTPSSMKITTPNPPKNSGVLILFSHDRNPCTVSTVRLFMNSHNDDDYKNGSNATIENHPTPPFVSFQVEEQGIMACDTFAILIACQLMGLVDVLNDPDFTRSGGWLQPIPLVPSTLGILVERIALFAFIWFPVSFIRLSPVEKYSSREKTNLQLTTVGETTDGPSFFLPVIFTVVLFSVVRIAMAVAVYTMTSSNIDVFDTLRDCYFVGLATSSFRFLYHQYFGNGR
jgi:hypothetical protein